MYAIVGLMALSLICASAGKAKQAFPDIEKNQWVEIDPAYSQPPSGGEHFVVGWNALTFDSVHNNILIMDRWNDSIRGETIYANAVMSLDLQTNSVDLLKLNNWKRESRTDGGYTTAPILPDNTNDPTPLDRHPYGCFTYVPYNNSVYLIYGANGSGPDGHPHDTWHFSIDENKWHKIDSADNPPFGVGSGLENSTIYDPNTRKIVYSMHGTETWLLDVTTNQWEKANAANEPGGRMKYSMSYDSKRNTPLLFGGYSGWNPKIVRKDLWGYDAAQNTWNRKSDAPEGTIKNSAMAYSPLHDIHFVQIEDATYIYRPANDSWCLLCRTEGVSPVHKTVAYDVGNDLFVMMSKEGYTTPKWWIMRYDDVDGPPVAVAVSPAKNLRIIAQTTDNDDVTDNPDDAISDLSVPISIQEALPDDIKTSGYQALDGRDRIAEPVRFGFPLPADSGVSSADQLGLANADTAQFRVLDFWDNGNIKWVLTDTLASLNAGDTHRHYALTTGDGDTGGNDLATDSGDVISVDTGAAQFTIKKSHFNFIDRVLVDGNEIVPPGTSKGIVIRGSDGILYYGAEDPKPEILIEENGPVRAVVKVNGTHYSNSGARNLDYTLRMHFVKGKPNVTASYTLRNASKHQVENAVWGALTVNIQTEMNNPQYVLNAHTGPLTGTVSDTETVSIFQGKNDFPYVGDYNFYSDEQRQPTGISGYTIRKGAEEIQEGDATQWIDLFFGSISSEGTSVAFGTRFAAGYWPQGLALHGDGQIDIGLFPEGNDRPYALKFNGHATREFFVSFNSDDAGDAFFRFQYPLTAKADNPDWYNTSGALPEKIVSITDEEAYYADNNWKTDTLSAMKPELKIYRHKYWGAGGASNQYDYTKINARNFLRISDQRTGGYYLSAEQRLLYNTDLAIHHTDDYYNPNTFDEVPDLQGPYGGVLSFTNLDNAELVPTQKVIFEGEHRHAYGIAEWYYLTGDERFKDAYRDWGEYMRTQGGYNRWGRGLFWNIYNLVDLYRFTDDVAYQNLAWDYFEAAFLEKTAVHVSTGEASSGMDWKRGFYVSENACESTDRSMAPFIKGAMLPRTLAYLYQYGGGTPYQKDRALDVLEAAVRFAGDELWFEYGQEPGNYGFPYRISADSAPPADVREADNWYGGYREAFPTFTYGYILTGDTDFLRKGEMLLKSGAANLMGVVSFQEWPDKQALQHLIEHRETYAVWEQTPISTTKNADGAYTVSFTVPENTKAYRLKYSRKTIVDGLEFDRYTRQYTYDPADYIPFFAASNVINEPAPSEAGTTQSMTVTVEGDEPVNFMLKVLIGPGGH